MERDKIRAERAERRAAGVSAVTEDTVVTEVSEPPTETEGSVLP